MPSNVQLVSDIILTRSSLPARLSANNFDLICAAHRAVHRVLGEGYASR